MNKPISDTYLLCRENAKAKGGISAGIATHNWVICANDLEMDPWAGAGNEIKECTSRIQHMDPSSWSPHFELLVHKQ